MSPHNPLVSFVLATHNRCAVVMNTLAQVARCGLDREEYEVIVVDNGSEDGTPEAAGTCADLVVRRERNAGSCAKAYGVERASGRFIVFLDDDSFPRPGSIPRMIERFSEDRKLGSAGFTVHLPDGRREGGALPGVFVGCGVGLRAEALRSVGGLDPTLFMQAEEYDLSFRLVEGGWTIGVYDDLHVEHLKTGEARKSDRTTFFDVRNNLLVVARYLPSPYYEVYRRDLLQRYSWLARRDGHMESYRRGVRAGNRRAALERPAQRHRRLSLPSLEYFYRWEDIHRCMSELAGSGVRRVVIADLGKNVYPFHRAAGRVGIEVTAIGDDRFCAPCRKYRGTPVVGFEEALSRAHDAVVVGNTSPVHGEVTFRRALACCESPVFFWFSSGSEREAVTCPELSETGA